MSYFRNVKSFDDLKTQFKKLAMENHPDKGGSTEAMQRINAEYDVLFPIYKRKSNVVNDETAHSTRSKFYTQNGWEGKNYDINLSTKDISKLIRTYVKTAYPDYKFSVTSEYYSGGSSIHVALMEAPYEAWKTPESSDNYINEYYMERNEALTDVCKTVLIDVINFINSYRMDDSDGMIDYFHTNFYYNVRVGKWDKPFKVVQKQPKIKSEDKKSNKLILRGNNVSEFKSESNIGYKIIADVDTRDNTPLWVMRVTSKLENFSEFSKRIRLMGGYYSRFKAGFIFKEDPTSKLATL